MTQLDTATPPAAAEGHPLDQAAWASLTGPHARFAQGTGKALRYPPDVSPIAAVPAQVDDEVWTQLAELVGPGAVVALAAEVGVIPDGWTVVFEGAGLQLVATEALQTDGPLHEEIVVLGADDVPQMLELVARTQPGPFEARTHELGTYYGVRRQGRLVAMAGERLHPPGWTEISAVCTDEDHRRQGLSTALVRAVAANIRSRGETPFLHAAASNVNAVRLYESIGFELRSEVRFTALRSPGDPATTADATSTEGSS